MSTVTLAAGLTALGIALPEAAQLKLLAFRDLLLKWNRTYNLTALRDPQQAVSHHLLDALAILPHVGAGPLLDVGSGGGLPGIPLAIARPDLSVTLVDTVQKKAAFLQQAVIELELKSVAVHHARVEEMRGQYAQISSRAFAELARFISCWRREGAGWR
jgi:16S rRNA (guanine527-N7)-methyltransferase